MSLPAVPRPSVSLLIPAYQERATIEVVMTRALSVLSDVTDDAELVVLDDASTDDTFAIMTAVAARDPRVRALRHPVNRGIAATFEELYGLATKDVVFLIAGDGQFPPEALREALPRLAEGFDIVVCRRIAKHYTPYRHFVSWAFRWLPRLLFGVDVIDPGSVKVVRRELFARVPVRSTSVFVEAERLIRARRLGYRIGAIDLETAPRLGGRASGARLSVAWRALVDLIRFRLFG